MTTTTSRTVGRASSAVFEDINKIAEKERQRRIDIDGEPPEIQLMRLQIVEDAKQMMADALVASALMKEEARQEGYEAGFAEGRTAGEQRGEEHWLRQCEELRRSVEELTQSLEAERQRIWTDAEPQIVSFVLEIARKVVKDDAEVNRDIALSVIRNALRRVVDTETIRLRVNLSDLETVRSNREDLASLLDGVKHLEIVDDRRVAPGGCVLETNAGNIDARLETQLDEVCRVVRQVVEEAA